MTSSEKRKPGRPATGETPLRTIKVGPLWDRAKAVAKGRGETLTALVIRAIENELKRLERLDSKKGAAAEAETPPES